MQQFLIFVLFFLIIFIGCASTPPRLSSPLSSHNGAIQTIVYIDRAFSPNEENDITNALKSWECSSNHQIRFKIFYNASYENFKYADIKSLFIWKASKTDARIVEADSHLVLADDKIKRTVVGLFVQGNTDSASVILIVIDRINDNLIPITTHEIGHFLLGNTHSDSKNSIMYPHIDTGAGKITALDIKKLCDIYHFDPTGMRECDIK